MIVPAAALLPSQISRRQAVIVLVCVAATVLTAFLVFSWLSLNKQGTTPVRAEHGVMDLRGVDLGAQTVRLDGDWEFYWQRFIPPELFVKQPPPVEEYLPLPKSWEKIVHDGVPLQKTGYATLRLRLLLTPQDKPLAIRLDHIYAAYKLWANGRLVAQSGTPASDAGRETANQTIQFAVLTGSEPVVDLVLQTSGFHPSWSSMQPIRLAQDGRLTNWQNRRWNVTYFVAGALMLMGVYHIALYLLRRNNRAALCFGLYTLLWMTTFLCIETDWAIRQFFPDLSSEVLLRIYRTSMVATSPLGYQFVRELYPREFPRWLLHLLWGWAAIYLLLALFAPIGQFLALIPFYYPFSAARVLYLIWGLAWATWRAREGAATILSGFTIFGILGINDMLNDMGIIDTLCVMHLGILCFMGAQALVLATRFSHLFDSVEHLSDTLSSKNRLLEQEIAERIRAQQDTVAVSEAERSRISHELHDGLCQQLTGARLLCSTLRRKRPAGDIAADELDRLAVILDASSNHAYELSHGLWPVETDDLDLHRTLTDLVKKQQEAGGIPIELSLDSRCEACACINAPHIHSIAREAIVNALKHARPSRIVVRLRCDGRGWATLTIVNDGIGWIPRTKTTGRGGLGLRIMAYRARMIGGDFRIETGETSDTRIIATLPCASQE